MKALGKSKIDRKETRVYNLIDNVDVSANKVNSEESGVFVESVGGCSTLKPRPWTQRLKIWQCWIQS